MFQAYIKGKLLNSRAACIESGITSALQLPDILPMGPAAYQLGTLETLKLTADDQTAAYSMCRHHGNRYCGRHLLEVLVTRWSLRPMVTVGKSQPRFTPYHSFPNLSSGRSRKISQV